MRYKENISAIVYCRRNDTGNIEKKLKETSVLVLNIVEDFISKRKAKDQILIEKYKELHQPPSLELKTLLLLRQFSADLSTLKAKKKRNRLSPKNRTAIHKRHEALKLQVFPPCELLMYVTFDLNVSKCNFSIFEVLAVNLPNWRFRRNKNVIRTIGYIVKAKRFGNS